MKLNLGPSPEFEKKHLKDVKGKKRSSFLTDKKDATKKFWKVFEKVSK
jgi:hypothetical protein